MFDIPLGPRRSARCDGLSRRDFLRVGGLSAFGLALPHLLRAEVPSAAGRKAKARAKSVILVFLGGGLSHHDTFDLKPDASDDVRSRFQPVGTPVPGLHVCEHLPQMAKVMDRVALVRS